MNIEETKIPTEENPVELVSLEELQEEIEACFCSNCGAEITGYSPDDWGLCQECHAELEPPEDNPEEELNFNS